jgi:uncharacterized protein (DUF849 family)
VGIRRIKACLNGGRARAEHAAVPTTPAELAEATAAAVAVGAEAVHVHPRSASGAESLAAEDIGAAVRAIRARCPGTPVGVSTGLWISGGNPAARHAAVEAWLNLSEVERPDFASVNVGELGSVAIARTLLAGGIGVEAGIWTSADAEALPRGATGYSSKSSRPQRRMPPHWRRTFSAGSTP